MSLFMWVITIVVLIIAIFTTKGLIAHKRRKVADAEICAHYEKILQAGNSGKTEDEDELLRVWDEETYNLPFELYDKFRLASSAIRTRRYQQAVLAELSELLQIVHSATDKQAQLEAYEQFFEIYLNKRVGKDYPKSSIEFDIEALKTNAAEIVQSNIDRLSEASQSDSNAFNELRNLFIKLESSYDCLRILCDLISYPKNYNYLVAINVANPHYRDFVGTHNPRDISSGVVRRLAAEALRDNDYVLAKIVLAYCNANHFVLAEVGDVLTSDLAKFVAAHEASLQAAKLQED